MLNLRRGNSTEGSNPSLSAFFICGGIVFVEPGEKVRVRFAPSPTGYLHVGGARTAIFNWLFAKKYGGNFLLRIEDTDAARSGEDMVAAILDGMSWLGLDWDDDVVFQSKRLEVYDEFVNQLIDCGRAYKCYCTKDEIEANRQLAKSENRDYRYNHDRRCNHLTQSEIQTYDKAEMPYAVRLLLPEGKTKFVDAVYGEITVEHSQLDDFIIRRSDGYPTYHLAVVVDDHEMQISHILRGDDHLSNTPKHIQIYHALGWDLPKYCHLPLILGKDKQRLSKRHGATAIGEYEKAGYLSVAMLNFLTLLGWSSGDDRELFSRDELVDTFSEKGIQKKSAVFDEKKLEWMNGQYLNALEQSEFYQLVTAQLLNTNAIDELFISKDSAYLRRMSELIQPRIKRLSEIGEMTGYFFKDPESYDQKALNKHWKAADQITRFEQIQQRLGTIALFSIEEIEAVIRGYAEELQVGAGKILQPLRLAVTGIAATPGMFEIMELLGKDTVLRRLQAAISYLKKNPVSSSTINAA